jgi:hypothetical protein
MHKHHWECTDTPGIFMCHAEGQTGYFNSLTREITEDVTQLTEDHLDSIGKVHYN